MKRWMASKWRATLFGKGIGATHQAAQACTRHAEEAFGVVGLAFFLAAEAVRAGRERGRVGQPVVAARGPGGDNLRERVRAG